MLLQRFVIDNQVIVDKYIVRGKTPLEILSKNFTITP
jgi:hypothetical protein